MKRISFITMLMCVALGATAQVLTGTAVITLSSASQGDKDLTIVQSASFSDAYDATWDAISKADGGIYVYYGGEHYENWATNTLASNLPIGFGTCDDLSYTLKFNNAEFSGTAFTVTDVVEGTTINVNGSASNYAFTIDAADKNKAINDRFLINFSASGNLQTCFTGTVLQITNNPYPGKIVVKNSGGTQITGSPFDWGTTEIDLSGEAAGNYTFIFGGDRSFIVTVE